MTATKSFCARCGRKFVGFATLCPSCEKTNDREASRKANREARRQRLADTKREGGREHHGGR
jgi:hypothetical protein